jgi:hypothetical protein
MQFSLPEPVRVRRAFIESLPKLCTGTHATRSREVASGRGQKYIRAQPLQFRAFQVQFAL